MSPPLTSHDTRRRDALSIDALVDRPSTRQCGKCQEAQTRCDGREPCRNCEVRGTLCGYAWSSFSAPHTLPPGHPTPQHPGQQFPPPAKRRSPIPTGSIFPRSNALDGGWAIVPQGTNAPTAHPSGPVLSCKTCQARNTPCDGVTPVCGSCRIRRLECYLATPASSNSMRNGTTTLSWSARDRQALNPRSFPPSLSQAAMLLPPSRPRAPSDASKPSSSSRASLSFMLNPKPEGKVASGSKGNTLRPAELKVTPTHHVTTPTHHVTPPTPVAPASMEKAQAIDVDLPVRDPPTSPSSSTGGATSLSRRPSRKRSASPESHYGREREDSPSRESVSSLGLSALAMGERRNRALSYVHSPRSSIDSHGRTSMDSHRPSLDGRPVFEPVSPRASHSARASMDSHSHSPTRSARNSIDSHPFSARGQPLDEARALIPANRPVDNSNRPLVGPSNRPLDPLTNRPADPHPGRPIDSHPVDAHRRSMDQQGLASPIDPNRPRSRSKSSLSHLLDGGGFGGMTSAGHAQGSVSPTRTSPGHTSQNKSMGSPIHTQASPIHTTQKSPVHTTHSHTTFSRPPRTPSSEFGPGPSPTGSFGPGPSPKAYGPTPSPTTTRTGQSPTTPFGPAKSPTTTSTSEPFSRPVSAESFTRPMNRDLPNPGPIPGTHPHPPKQSSISTALGDMQLKSGGTSRASSPGGHRDVFVHSGFNGGNARHYPNWTFAAAGENLVEGRKAGMANVWRHETEAGMRRREVEAELRKQDHGELQRRRSEGAKRRKLGEEDGDSERERRVSGSEERRMFSTDDGRMSSTEDRRMSTTEDRRMSIVAEERRMSIVEDKHEPERTSAESGRRMSIAESERRMSIVEPEKRSLEPEKRAEPEKRTETERKGSISESDRRMSIVEHVRKATEAQNARDTGNKTSNSLPNPRGTTADIFARARRGSLPMPGLWTDEKQSVIVISDSPELDTGDAEMDIPDQSEKLFPGRTTESTAPVATEGSSRSADQSTPHTPFGHIWPAPVIDSGKKGRRPKDPEPALTRSFITPLNLPPVPLTTHVKQSTPVVDDDKEAGSSQPSVLRSMLTTMPPRAAFVTAVQTFLSQPASKTRRNRAVIMTKSLMKDALGVLLDPNTDELLKDYVPPEKKKEDDKSDGTRRKMSLAIDITDHASLEFRAWARRMFSTVKTSRGEDVLAYDGKPVVVEDDIYETIVICHSQGNHCSTDETAKLVDQEHSWVPRALIEAFVQKCPGCPLENKITNTTTKPKKRKSVRGGATGAAGSKRKPTTGRRGKKAQDGESLRRSRKSSGKEASPDESDGEEGDQEEDELKESGDEAGPADVKTDDPEPEPAGEDQDQDQDQDEAEQEQEPDLEPDADDPDDPEEPEMESEDEHVSRPSPVGRKNGL